VTPSDCKNGGLIANNLVEHNYSKGIQLMRARLLLLPAYVHRLRQHSVNNGSVGAVIWEITTLLSATSSITTTKSPPLRRERRRLYSGTATFVDHNLTWSTSDRSGKRSDWYVKQGCWPQKQFDRDPLFLDAAHRNWESQGFRPAKELAGRLARSFPRQAEKPRGRCSFHPFSGFVNPSNLSLLEPFNTFNSHRHTKTTKFQEGIVKRWK